MRGLVLGGGFKVHVRGRGNDLLVIVEKAEGLILEGGVGGVQGNGAGVRRNAHRERERRSVCCYLLSGGHSRSNKRRVG